MREINKKKNKLSVFIGLYIYRIILDLCYFKIIAPNFNYYGFYDNKSTLTFILSWIIMIIFSFPIEKVINDKKTTFSNIIIFALSIISIVPFSTLIYSGILTTKFIIMNTIYWEIIFILYFFIRKIKVKPKIIKIGNKMINDKFVWIFGLFSLGLVLYLSYRYTHFRFNFNLFNVYELRSETKGYNFPTIFQYLFPWTRVLNILFLAYACKNKKYFMAFIFFVVQMLSFGIDGLKATFFMPFIVIVVFILYKKENFSHYKKITIWGISGLSLLGLFENIIWGTYNLVNIIIRRVLFIPVYLNSCYVDFFSKNNPDYFKSSFLRFLGFESEYENLGNIIGETYFNKIEMNCNNGLISDAVTSFGTIGIIIMPILLIIVLRLMDECTCDLDEKIFFVTALYFAIILTNSFLFTSLITHGLLIACVVLLVMSSKGRKME